MKPKSYRIMMEQSTANDNAHLNGAAILDADGNEIAITEEMIKKALENCECNGLGGH